MSHTPKQFTAQSGDLILSSSIGSYVTVSGNLRLSTYGKLEVGARANGTGPSVYFGSVGNNGVGYKDSGWICSPSVVFGWNSVSNLYGGTIDTYISKDSAGVVRISDSSFTGSTLVVGNVVNDLGHLILSSSGGSVVAISDFIVSGTMGTRSWTTAEISTGSYGIGQMAYVSDGDGGSPCLAVFNGTDWKVISLGATIS